MSNETMLPVHSPINNISGYPPIPRIQPSKPVEPPSAEGIARLTVHIPSAFREDVASSVGLSRPRWGTNEFKFYYLVTFFAIPAMIWIPISLSRDTHPNYDQYAQKLSEGWIYDRLVDNSDPQYRSFRDNLRVLCKAAFGYLTIKYIRTHWFINPWQGGRFYMMPTNVILSLVTIVALHGASSVKILIIMAINFMIATKCRGAWFGPVLTWGFNGMVLFCNETYHGYRFGAIFSSLEYLDTFNGVFRWHVMFNITMLRLISFNMDYHWACNNTESAKPELVKPTEKQRVNVPHKDEMYSVMNYVSYVLYPPLYIAGPIITFNDFVWQHRRPIVLESHAKIMYIIRYVACYMTMEYVLHFMYVVAIKDKKAWLGDSPAEIAMIGFWNLIIVWLKLLIPWRFFRAWALLDGVDPPENMVRCMANNYSTFGFWRSWHRSYNLWIIRYIYIPLGGSKNPKNLILNTVLVFSFVALWHDLTFRLLAWGWLISLFVLPELVASYLLPASKYGKYPWYRHVCAIGGVLNIIMMMAANLVGFVVGPESIKFLVGQLFGTLEGARFMLLSACCMFVGVQLMFEYREEELRQGIQRRC
ncbi:MBOAT, membrane-bound O-acyltransferase family-domain-containing protein [Crassisporium funariophilum]|nr:MBOAT, membrane-bound O-acyltransferase family-domain-containing protein [Crassisporium funariophilum]